MPASARWDSRRSGLSAWPAALGVLRAAVQLHPAVGPAALGIDHLQHQPVGAGVPAGGQRPGTSSSRSQSLSPVQVAPGDPAVGISHPAARPPGSRPEQHPDQVDVEQVAPERPVGVRWWPPAPRRSGLGLLLRVMEPVPVVTAPLRVAVDPAVGIAGHHADRLPAPGAAAPRRAGAARRPSRPVDLAGRCRRTRPSTVGAGASACSGPPGRPERLARRQDPGR